MILLLAFAQALLLDPFVIDGDTIGDAATGARYRVADLDAPEIWGARCAGERQRGEQAAAAAQRLIARARRVEITPTGAMSGKRIVASVRIDGADFATAMIAGRFARPWTGRRAAWCPARAG